MSGENGAYNGNISTLKSHCQRRLHLKKIREKHTENAHMHTLKQQQTKRRNERTNEGISRMQADNLNENELLSVRIR